MEVCKAALLYHFPEEGDISGRDGLDLAKSFCFKAQRYHALATGRPYSKASFSCRLSRPQDSCCRCLFFDYEGGNLVWVDRGTGTGIAIAHVRSLRTGRVFTITPYNREGIVQVKISSSLVVVVSNLG